MKPYAAKNPIDPVNNQNVKTIKPVQTNELKSINTFIKFQKQTFL